MEKIWWKEAVVYQIWPRSFSDSNGDGIGDIRGIISKLDYLKELGVNIVWLNPILKSPDADGGYDASDYYSIQDHFGTMDDWEKMVEEMHKRGIKLIMDLSICYTSDKHPWFIESRSSRNNDKRDYYFWRDGKNGKEPNNWEGMFKIPSWTYDKKTGQYYFHLFTPQQPDLNWHNPEVRKNLYKIMKFWLDKGIDGFRFDVANGFIKKEDFPDAPNDGTSEYIQYNDYYFNQPGLHKYAQEMNREVLSKYNIMTVAETENITVEEALKFVDWNRHEYNMNFSFEHMHLDEGPGGWFDPIDWKLSDFKAIITRWQIGMQKNGWNSLYLDNHDQPRLVSRFGDDGKYRVQSAKMLATMLHTLQGTPYIFQGEEIGMTNVRFDNIEDYKDVYTQNYYKKELKPDRSNHDNMMEAIYKKARDNARSPVQWNEEKNAGFTTATPWMKVNTNYTEINVEEALRDKDSIFYFYKKLIKLRKQNDIIVYGDYTPLLEKDEKIFSYLRQMGDDRLLVILNFYKEEAIFRLPGHIGFKEKELIISNYQGSTDQSLSNLKLKPYEAKVYRLK